LFGFYQYYYLLSRQDTQDFAPLEDPQVSGVVLYVNDFSKPITNWMKGDFFRRGDYRRALNENEILRSSDYFQIP